MYKFHEVFIDINPFFVNYCIIKGFSMVKLSGLPPFFKNLDMHSFNGVISSCVVLSCS